MQQNININSVIIPRYMKQNTYNFPNTCNRINQSIIQIQIPYTRNKINQPNISIIESKKIEWITKYPFYVMQYIYIYIDIEY